MKRVGKYAGMVMSVALLMHGWSLCAAHKRNAATIKKELEAKMCQAARLIDLDKAAMRLTELKSLKDELLRRSPASFNNLAKAYAEVVAKVTTMKDRALRKKTSSQTVASAPKKEVMQEKTTQEVVSDVAPQRKKRVIKKKLIRKKK